MPTRCDSSVTSLFRDRGLYGHCRAIKRWPTYKERFRLPAADAQSLVHALGIQVSFRSLELPLITPRIRLQRSDDEVQFRRITMAEMMAMWTTAVVGGLLPSRC